MENCVGLTAAAFQRTAHKTTYVFYLVAALLLHVLILGLGLLGSLRYREPRDELGPKELSVLPLFRGSGRTDRNRDGAVVSEGWHRRRHYRTTVLPTTRVIPAFRIMRSQILQSLTSIQQSCVTSYPAR